jgi:hypothetical protein
VLHGVGWLVSVYSASYGLQSPGFECRYKQQIFSSSNRPDRFWVPSQSVFCSIDIEVKNEWSLISASPVGLHSAEGKTLD